MEKTSVNRHNYDVNVKKIEKYYGNPFLNTKEDYYNEVVQKILCSILLKKNIKQIDFLVFDLLVDHFVRFIKEFGNKCKTFSSLRGSLVVNYIDIKSCLKLHFPILYKEIYISKNYSLLHNNLFLDTDLHSKSIESISILQNSYLYYKHLCMRKNERPEGMNPNEFKNMNYLYSKNHLPIECSSANENVDVLFLNEDTDFEKYKEIMKLKKKYIHDHMPVIPIHINMKEKKTGILEKVQSEHEDSSSSSSSSSSHDSDGSSSSCTHSSSSVVSSQGSKQSEKKNQTNYFSDEDISKEKIEILNLLPKLKEIYSQNSKRKKEPLTSSDHNTNNNDHKNFSFNSFNTFETLDDL